MALRFMFLVAALDQTNGKATLHLVDGPAKAGKLKLTGLSSDTWKELGLEPESEIAVELGDVELPPVSAAPPPPRQFPSQGRIVQAFHGGEWRPAIVTEVHGEFCVNAYVFPRGEERTSLTHVEQDEHPFEGCWRWPPRVTDYESYLASVSVPLEAKASAPGHGGLHRLSRFEELEGAPAPKVIAEAQAKAQEAGLVLESTPRPVSEDDKAPAADLEPSAPFLGDGPQGPGSALD